MKQLPMLIRREFWENRMTFLYLPLSITALFTGILIIVLIGLDTSTASINVNVNSEWKSQGQTQVEQHQFVDSSLMDLFGARVQELAASPVTQREAKLNQIYTGSSVIWFSVLWIVVFTYLLGSLYQDRRDRSFLFWKSLPISDAITVASKLLAGLVLAPGIYFLSMVIGHLVLAIFASIAAVGMNIDIWQTFWVSSNFIGRWFSFIGTYAFALLWCLPLAGWLVLVSATAKSVPAAWAIGVPIVLVILESVLFRTSWIGDFIRWHSFSFEFMRNSGHILSEFDLNRALQLAIAMVLGMGMIYLAVWQRGRADEL